MIYVKIIGSLFVVLSFVYAGYLFSIYESLALKEGEAFLNLMRHIRSRISCYKTPLSEIIAAYSNRELEECGFLRSFDMSWNGALAAADKLHIDNTARKLLESFGEEIGGSYKDEQVICCDYYIEKLEAHLASLREELAKKQKLIRSFALILGILIVIILI